MPLSSCLPVIPTIDWQPNAPAWPRSELPREGPVHVRHTISRHHVSKESDANGVRWCAGHHTSASATYRGLQPSPNTLSEYWCEHTIHVREFRPSIRHGIRTQVKKVGQEFDPTNTDRVNRGARPIPLDKGIEISKIIHMHCRIIHVLSRRSKGPQHCLDTTFQTTLPRSFSSRYCVPPVR